jgi:hypothetical protein
MTELPGPEGDDVMEIKLTKRQYEVLMRLVYLGNWVVNGFHAEDADEETDALENSIYGKARDFGLAKLVFYDEENDGWYPTNETEDEWLLGLDDYKNDMFWEELEYRLADRDLVAQYGEIQVDHMDPETRSRMETEVVDRYYEEFIKNGLKNLVLMRPN